MTVVLNLFGVVAIATLAWWNHRRATPAIAGVYWPSLLFKLTAGIVLGLLYKYYFKSGSDTFGFFADALRINNWAFTDGGGYLRFVFGGELGVEIYNSEPRTLLFIKILSLVNFLSGFNYWISACWLSLFSFVCAWRLFEVMSSHFPQHRTAAAIAFLFFPSVVFWSSGVLKESIAWGAVCLLSATFINVINGRRQGTLSWFLTIGALLLLLNLKYYWAAVISACMITSLTLHFVPWTRAAGQWKTTVAWFALFVALGLVVSRMHPNFYIERFVSVIVENHDKILRSSEPENTIGYWNMHQSWGSLVVNAPWALLSGLFRPFLFEAHSIASAVYAVENLVLLVLVVAYFIRPVWSSRNQLLVLAAITATIVLCIFLCLSTPNFGTLSRYRIGFLSFLVMALLAGGPLMRFFPKRFRLEAT